MKVFLTGHKGYLGSRFVENHSGDYDIVGYDLSEGDDVLDYENLRNKMTGCDQVVHLAAIPKPVEGVDFNEYFRINVEGTNNVAQAAGELGLRRIVYASSTAIYGIEPGIPFLGSRQIKEEQPFVSQYLGADDLSCREADLSYHMSKVMAEQIMAQYGLTRNVQTVCLRFGPIGRVSLGTSVSDANAVQAIDLALRSDHEFWYEPYNIVDPNVTHIDTTKARNNLGYHPEPATYPADLIYSTFNDRTLL